MAKPRLESCEVDGIDVSSYVVTWKINRDQTSNISTATVQFNLGIESVISFDENNASHTIEIWRGVLTATETRIFYGTIETFDKDGRTIYCSCECNLGAAVSSEVTKSFDKNIDTEAGVISEIFSTLMEDYAGLTAVVGDTVVDSGALNTLSKFICNHADVYERCEKLSEALDWIFYYDPDTDKVHFEPKGTQTSSLILTVGSNVTNNPKWRYDKTQIVNKYSIIGGEELVETEEDFNGDGAEDTFTLTYTPVSVRVEVGGTLQVGGNDTTTTAFDYSVDPDNKEIIFETGSVPGVGVGNVVVIYSHLLPRPVLAKDDLSILTYGLKQKTNFFTELVNVDDVKLYAKQYISVYKDPFRSTQLYVIDAEDLFPGQSVQIIDNVNNINDFFYVTKVEMFYPYTSDKVTVNDSDLREINFTKSTTDRVRRLEEEQGSNQDKLTQLFDLTRPVFYKRRYVKKQKRTVTGTNIGIYGNHLYGIYGTAQYGTTDLSATTAVFVHQGQSRYKELCYDTVFHDAGSSTATFDTGNKRIDFTAAQVWTSSAIFLGTTFSWVTLNLGTLTGSVAIEISADGKGSWQTLTAGARTAITSADATGVYVRLTEDAAGTARVEPTTNIYGQVTNPAIDCYMEE